MQKFPEADLLLRIAQGDESAFGQLYDRLAPVLFGLAFRILRDTAAAEDVLQEAFLQIWDSAADYDAQLGNPLAWAVSLTRNKAIDRLRASQRRCRLTEEAGRDLEFHGGDSPDAIASAMLQDNVRCVRSALAQLGAEQRQAIELAFFKGLTQTQIAEMLELPLGTVKARIRRAMLQLREALSDYL